MSYPVALLLLHKLGQRLSAADGHYLVIREQIFGKIAAFPVFSCVRVSPGLTLCAATYQLALQLDVGRLEARRLAFRESPASAAVGQFRAYEFSKKLYSRSQRNFPISEK